MKNLTLHLSCISLLFIGNSCILNPNLRTARVLNKHQLEIAAGAAGNCYSSVEPVIIGAYGITDTIEIEAKYLTNLAGIAPRVQILRSEKHYVDFLMSMELGYQKTFKFYYQPGVMIGRRFRFLEPYLSYQFAKSTDMTIQYILAGNRFHLSSLLKKKETKSINWFMGIEGGLAIFDTHNFWRANGAQWQYAVNIGFNY